MTHFLASSSSVSWNCFFKLSFSYKYDKIQSTLKVSQKDNKYALVVHQYLGQFQIKGCGVRGSGVRTHKVGDNTHIWNLKKYNYHTFAIEKKVEPSSLEKLGLLSINLGTQSPLERFHTPLPVLTLMTWLIFFSDSESLFVNSEATLWTSSVSVSLNSSSWWIWLYYSKNKKLLSWHSLMESLTKNLKMIIYKVKLQKFGGQENVTPSPPKKENDLTVSK